MNRNWKKYLLITSAIALAPAIAKSDILKNVPKALFSETPYRADIEPAINLTNIIKTPEKIEEENKEIKFSADEMETNSIDGIVTAIGSVQIIRGDMILSADKIIYNKKLDTIIAIGNTSIIDGTGNIVYADYINLRDNMDKIGMDNIKVVLNDKSNMAARKFTKFKNDNKLLENAIYSPCDLCVDEDPLWQIKARKIRHNAESQDLNYNDAFLEIKGIPVMYIPFFSHPDPTVKKRSGLLAPSFTTNNYFGPRVTTRYFWNISDNETMLMRPGISSKIGPIFGVDYDKYFYNAHLKMSGNYLRDHVNEEYGKGHRGNLYVNGRYEINNNWVADTDFKYVSDRTFLRDMSLKERDDAWLTSNVRFQGFYGRSYASIEAYHYKLLSYDLRQADKPYVMPLMMYEQVGDINSYGFYNKNQYSAAAIYREEDDSSYRATMINSWVLPSTTSYGAKTKAMASVKSDFYYIDNYNNLENEDFTGTIGRAFPQLSYEWRLPFVKATESSRQIIEPIVVAVMSPNGGNKQNKIPNNDSENPRLDDTNILDIDRYAGYDVNDNGSRVSYGINWSSYGDITGRSSFLLAQSYNINQKSTFSDEVGTDRGSLSDYVGRLYANPHKYLDFNYRFIADRKDYELKYSEIATRIGSNVLNAEIAYIFLKDNNVDTTAISSLGERKELYTAINMSLTQYWSLSIYNRQDLTENGGSLEHGGKLVYEDECLILSTNAKKDKSNDPQYRGGYEFSVDFFLKTLGGIGTN